MLAKSDPNTHIDWCKCTQKYFNFSKRICKIFRICIAVLLKTRVCWCMCVSVWGNQLCSFEVWSSTWGWNHSDRMNKWMNRWIKPLLSFISCCNLSLPQNTHKDKHTAAQIRSVTGFMSIDTHTHTQSGRKSKWCWAVWSVCTKLILAKHLYVRLYVRACNW